MINELTDSFVHYIDNKCLSLSHIFQYIYDAHMLYFTSAIIKADSILFGMPWGLHVCKCKRVCVCPCACVYDAHSQSG